MTRTSVVSQKAETKMTDTRRKRAVLNKHTIGWSTKRRTGHFEVGVPVKKHRREIDADTVTVVPSLDAAAESNNFPSTVGSRD